ncbi:MAG: PAS domain S-box protein [Candidatus Nanopelagicales bacterium]
MPDPERPAWAGLAASALDGFPDPTILLEAVRDAAGRVVDATILDLNRACAADLRSTHDALLDQLLVGTVPFAAQVLEHLALALESDDALVVDNVVVENVYDHFRMMLDVRGVRVGPGTAVVSWRDVTAYADLLDAAVLAEHRQRLLAENASDIVLLRGTSGITTWVSPSVTALLGWTVEDIEGTDLIDIIHPDDRAAVRAIRGRVLVGERPGSVLARLLCRDGRDRWMTCVSVPLEEDGVVVGATVGLRDVDEQVRAQQAAELSEQRYRLLAENASDVVALRDRVGRVQWISPSIEHLLGWDPDTIVGSDLMDLVAPEDRATASEARALVNSGGGEQRFVARFRRHDGDQRWMTVVSRPLVNDDGLTTGAVVGMRDVHDLVVAQRAAEESETRYRLLAEHSSDVIFLSNERTDLEWVSPSSRDTLGWDSEQLTGRRAVEFIHPDELAMLRRNVTESTQSGATIRVRYRWVRPDGSYRWMEALGRPFVDESTGENRRVVQLRDVHDQMLAERELSRRARYDELTHLLSRGEILRRLGERLADRRARAGSVAILYCDLDGLKGINDNLGHAAGDRLIQASAERIRGCVRADDLVGHRHDDDLAEQSDDPGTGDHDLVGRLGGDEILVLLDGITSVDDVVAIAEKLVRSVSEPIELVDEDGVVLATMTTTVSVGIAVAVDGDVTDSLVARADQAMFVAKSEGGGRVVVG